MYGLHPYLNSEVFYSVHVKEICNKDEETENEENSKKITSDGGIIKRIENTRGTKVHKFETHEKEKFDSIATQASNLIPNRNPCRQKIISLY